MKEEIRHTEACVKNGNYFALINFNHANDDIVLINLVAALIVRRSLFASLARPQPRVGFLFLISDHLPME